MKKIILFLTVLLLFACNNGDVEDQGTSISGGTTADSAADFTGFKIINNHTEPLYYYIGIKGENGAANTVLVDVGVIYSGNEVIVDNLPIEKYVDIWTKSTPSDNYYIIYENDNRLDKKYYFKVDGSYLFTSETKYSYTFDLISENSSIVSTIFMDENNSDDILLPEVKVLNSNMYTPMEIVEGNVWRSGTDYIYGVYKFKNPTDRKFSLVKVYYNFLDSNGNRAFNQDEYTYIEGAGYYTYADNVSFAALKGQSTVYINIIDSFKQANFPISSIAAIEFRFDGEEEESLNLLTNEVEVVNTSFDGVSNEFTYSIKNNMIRNISVSSSLVLAKNSRGQYVEWDWVSGDVKANSSEIFTKTLYRHNGQKILTTEFTLVWDYSATTSLNIQPSRSLKTEDYIYNMKKERDKQLNIIANR